MPAGLLQLRALSAGQVLGRNVHEEEVGAPSCASLGGQRGDEVVLDELGGQDQEHRQAHDGHEQRREARAGAQLAQAQAGRQGQPVQEAAVARHQEPGQTEEAAEEAPPGQARSRARPSGSERCGSPGRRPERRHRPGPGRARGAGCLSVQVLPGAWPGDGPWPAAGRRAAAAGPRARIARAVSNRGGRGDGAAPEGRGDHLAQEGGQGRGGQGAEGQSDAQGDGEQERGQAGRRRPPACWGPPPGSAGSRSPGCGSPGSS